jgi:acetylglutamate kinase
MNKAECENYKLQGVIADGMIPKLDNSFSAMEKGVSKVIILHAKNLLKQQGTVLR